jgi:putative selenium metabolism hydrolase
MEEMMEGTSLQTVMDVLRPDLVVIGEATELHLARGGRGRAEIHIETLGKPAHSSSPHLGINAVHEMLPVLAAIEQLPLPNDLWVGPALLALTDIISDPYPAYSVIPTRCRVTYDRRLIPGETPESVLGELLDLPAGRAVSLRAIIADGQHSTYTGTVLRGPKFFPAWVLPEEHAFVQAALRGLRAAGLAPSMRAYQFCTNAAYSAGVAGVPTVGFGPGAEADAHIEDERLSLKALWQAAQGYFGIIQACLCDDRAVPGD